MISRKLFALTLGLLAATLAIAGCKDDGAKSSEGNERVGVVNIAKVEQDLGWDHQIDAASRECAEDLRKQYEDLVGKYDKALADKMKQFGLKEGDKLDKLSAAQQQELMQTSQVAQTVRAQGPAAAQERHNAYRVALDNEYRKKLDPLIEEVAKEKKMTIVLAQTPAMMYSDPTIDVSKAVATAAKFKPPQISKPAFPKLQVQDPQGLPQPMPPATAPVSKP
jgi:Skp family chaperone for outer membrane proteins